MSILSSSDSATSRRIRTRLITEFSSYQCLELEEQSTTVRSRSTTLTGVPHSLVHQSSERTSTHQLVEPTIFVYDENTSIEPNYTSIGDVPPVRSQQCLWIDVPGVHDSTLLSALSERFRIHQLVIEDIQKNEQRTKLDVFEDALFLVLKLIYSDPVSQKTHVEQISFYLKENILITFQEKPTDIFDQVKNRIRSHRGRVRHSKIDYLFYSLLDTIVDKYIDVFDIVSNNIGKTEAQLMKSTSRNSLETIYDLKREMFYYRRMISPLKEIINKLMKEEETQIIQESTLIYLRDLFDHVVQVNDTIDTYREMLASFIDFYMTMNANGMNEVMKTLTIISTIFIPLTFVAGVYGMNFDNMPEIQWKYGYFVVLTCMLGVTLIMLFCFKRKGWFL